MSHRKVSFTAIVVATVALFRVAVWYSGAAQQSDPVEPQQQGAAVEQPAKSAEQPPAKSEAKPLPREKYRYDGKSFARWQEYALTELKVERRLEALKAMQAFAVRGYGAEAAETILQILREHYREFPKDPSGVVSSPAVEVFTTIGRASAPTLLKGLKDPALSDTCLRALREVPLEAADVRILVEMANTEPPLAGVAIDALGRDDIQAPLLEIMKQEATARLFVTVLRRALKDEKLSAAHVLGNLGQIARPAVPDLIDWLNWKYRPWAVIQALGKIHCDADKVVPALIGAIDPAETYQFAYIAEALGNFGPQANDAVPVLLKNLYGERYNFAVRPIRKEVLTALQRIGAKPGEIVPALVSKLPPNDMSYSSLVRDEESLKLCLDYLEKIGPEAKDAIPALARVFADRQEARAQITRVLRAIGPDGEEALLKLNESLPKGR